MNIVWVYEAEILKFGSSEVVKKLHIASTNMFDATHMLVHYVHDDNSEFKIPVEIGSIRRLTNIESLIIDPDVFSDDDEDFDGDVPIEIAKDMPDDEVITFDCQCHEKLRVPNAMFPFVTCPNCDLKILRKEIRDVGGIYIYEKAKDNNDD